MKTFKKFTLIAAGIIAAGAASAQTKQALKLTGTLSNTAGKVYLQKFHNKMFRTIDSASVKDGKFAFKKAVELPELYGVSLDTTKSPFYVFLENKPVTIQLDSAKYYANTVATGSSSQDLFTEYKKTRGVKIDEFIKSNPSSIVSAYVLYRDFSYRLSPEQIVSNINLLDKNLHKTDYVNVLNGLVSVLNTVAVGKTAPDFELPNADGKLTKLSSQRGKYVLLDFWAAWCGPCRRENPNVVKAFQKYKDKGFTVYGVSLDKSKDAWVKAIKDDQLDWTQVSDLAFWNSAPAKLYGVRAIPSNFLIDPNGVIIARNLRGEDLDKQLDEILIKKSAQVLGK